MAKVIKSGFGRPPVGKKVVCCNCGAHLETDGNEEVVGLEIGRGPPLGWYIKCPECGYGGIFVHKNK